MLLFSGRDDPTGAVLGYVIDMPVVVHVKVVDITVVAQWPFLLCNDSAVWFRRQKTVQVRSCSLNVVDAPVMQILRLWTSL